MKRLLKVVVVSMFCCCIVFGIENTKENQIKAPAPVVSEVRIIEICSSDAGCESISSGQTSTNLNHGGSSFYVKTRVIGYGGRNTDSATFAGNQATMLDCNGVEGANRVVVGWNETWDVSKPKNTNGDFVYTARSINPGPTMSVTIYIK